MATEDFGHSFGHAMRTGQPGWCLDPMTLQAKQWHVLRPENVQALREIGTGGLTWCEDCGRAIFVPGGGAEGIVLRGLRPFLGRTAPMKGVRL